MPSHESKAVTLSSPVKSSKLDEDFIKAYLYLFLIDADHLSHQGSLPEYEAREPGYTQALLNAYNFAFSQKLEKLTPSLIEHIHRHAMQHLPSTGYGHKTAGNNFPVFFHQKHPSLSQKGFRQFIQDWLIDTYPAMHMVQFKSQASHNSHYELLPFSVTVLQKQGCLTLGENKNGQIINTYSRNEAKEKFDKKINELIVDKNYTCHIVTIPIEILPILGHRKPLQDTIQDCEQKICDSYNLEISKAKNSDQKVKTVIRHAQWLTQLHTRNDGNSRLAYILMNRMLHQQKEPLALMANPNQLECLSREELFPIIRDAQQRFYTLMQGRLPLDFDQNLPPIILSNSASTSEFMTNILKKNLQQLNKKSVEENSFAFFSQRDLLALMRVSKEYNKTFSAVLNQRK